MHIFDFFRSQKYCELANSRDFILFQIHTTKADFIFPPLYFQFKSQSLLYYFNFSAIIALIVRKLKFLLMKYYLIKT